MDKFHVHPVTGVVSKCQSKRGKCPFGGASGEENHYTSRDEALKGFENLMKETTIPTLSKSTGDGENNFPVGDVRRVLKDFIEKLEVSNPEAAYAINTFLNNLENSPLPNTVRDLNKEMLKRLPAGSGGLRQALNFNNALYKAYEKYSLEISGLKMNYNDFTDYSANRSKILQTLEFSKESGSEILVKADELALKKLDEKHEELKAKFGENSFSDAVEERLLPQFLKDVETLSKRKISKKQ